MPRDYGKEIIKHIKKNNCEVVHLQRLLFCMGRLDTSWMLSTNNTKLDFIPDRVRQNWQGGTLALKKDAFFRIGGYDVQFVGWGGEDNEFYDRCRTLNGWRYGYMPFIHLWHKAQTEKLSTERERNLKYLRILLGRTPEERIASLKPNQNSSIKKG